MLNDTYPRGEQSLAKKRLRLVPAHGFQRRLSRKRTAASAIYGTKKEVFAAGVFSGRGRDFRVFGELLTSCLQRMPFPTGPGDIPDRIRACSCGENPFYRMAQQKLPQIVKCTAGMTEIIRCIIGYHFEHRNDTRPPSGRFAS